MPEQGDILLIPVPFTDLSSQKQRPVVVISIDNYNNKHLDIVVVAMTSNPSEDEYSFMVENVDLLKGILKRPSRIRVDKIYTLSQSIAVHKFGAVKPATLERIRTMLQTLVAAK